MTLGFLIALILFAAGIGHLVACALSFAERARRETHDDQRSG